LIDQVNRDVKITNNNNNNKNKIPSLSRLIVSPPFPMINPIFQHNKNNHFQNLSLIQKSIKKIKPI